MCQDKCIDHWLGLVGISTYDSYYCYCWFDDSQLPSKIPSDIHGYSSKFKGEGEVVMTNNDEGDCYKFLLNVISTETPTMMPTESPSISPTRKPTAIPTSYPTQKPTEGTTMSGDFTYMGDGWCKDHRYDYYDFVRYSTSDVSQCPSLCIKSKGFVGYSSYFNYFCYCWYSNNQLPAIEDTSNIYIWSYFGGEGEVKQIQYTGWSKCYAFNEKTNV